VKFFTAKEIRSRVVTLAAEIGRDPVHLIIVLQGAFIFAADLARHLHEVTMEFVVASSYREATISSGEVALLSATTPLTGDVLIVEDIVDTGRTVSAIKSSLYQRGVSHPRVVSLLDKPSRRVVPVTVDFVGFTVPDMFVYGYGMDSAGRFRHLPDIWSVE